jgi:adenylate kinase family enzyme
MGTGADFGRTLILGNSGSGKSWLSVRLAEAVGAEATDLDGIHWEPGGYNIARDKHVAIALVRRSADGPTWIIEGVYGWLAQEVTGSATALIWLDLPVDQCIENLQQRGLRRGGDEAAFAALLAWAADYPHRQTSSSLAGHRHVFDSFPRRKLRCSSRADVEQLLAGLRQV